MVNEVLKRIDGNLLGATECIQPAFRDEVRQDVRLKIWHYVENNYKKDDDIDIILDDCKCRLNFFIFLSYKYIIRNYRKFYDRNKSLNDLLPSSYRDDIEPNYFDNYNYVDLAIDMEKYRKALTKKEFYLLTYLIENKDTFVNFDAISRQFGYTGKGASKYFLTRIAKKISKLDRAN